MPKIRLLNSLFITFFPHQTFFLPIVVLIVTAKRKIKKGDRQQSTVNG